MKKNPLETGEIFSKPQIVIKGGKVYDISRISFTA